MLNLCNVLDFPVSSANSYKCSICRLVEISAEVHINYHKYSQYESAGISFFWSASKCGETRAKGHNVTGPNNSNLGPVRFVYSGWQRRLNVVQKKRVLFHYVRKYFLIKQELRWMMKPNYHEQMPVGATGWRRVAQGDAVQNQYTKTHSKPMETK